MDLVVDGKSGPGKSETSGVLSVAGRLGESSWDIEHLDDIA